MARHEGHGGCVPWEEAEQLRSENRDLRLMLGILAARADGRLEVTTREIAEARPVTIHRHEDIARDVVVFTLTPER